LGEKEISQRLGCQLGNRNHESPSSWFRILRRESEVPHKRSAKQVYSGE
jgi:hypothetical protein